ncbi:Aspartokinase [Polystyrenella longa]|uniref:aspartate kinase n=1 Tax=Polystyrenella longa TaxID=2528007 RepID=A0A518CS94_9PLAN|nr:aspartate kinase [Polystyrenella longa]QDU82092.1 Aspartokinase [Polystyrenella longa]
MGIIVQKFGGTSVADASKIKSAAARAVETFKKGHQVVMVVSARGKKTDELVALATEITNNPSPREMDVLLSTGEQETIALMSMAIAELGVAAESMTGTQIGIITDSAFSKARIQKISTMRMHKALDAGRIIVAAGFQGRDENYNITTLGRGGSDSTATALAAVLQADECQIYTDVEGVFTTDPRLVPSARKVDSITYEEMLELASLGAGVMHSRSIEFAKKYRIPLRVRPSFSDGEGTLIHATHEEPDSVVTGVALVRDEVRVTLLKIPDRPGVMHLIFSKMAEKKIAIDMVVQNVGEDGLAEVSFTVPQNELADTLTAADAAVKELGSGKVRHGTNLSKVSAVGRGMVMHSGVAAQMFKALADQNISISLITTSDIKISTLVDREDADKAINAVHSGFFLDQAVTKPLPIGEETEQEEETVLVARDRSEQEVISRLPSMEDIVVSEVELDCEQARVTIRNLPDNPGVAAHVFETAAEGGINVDMIVQNISRDEHASLSFTVPRDDIDSCLKLMENLLQQWPETEISHDAQIAKISVLGIGLRSHTGVGQKLFAALAEANVNIQMINTSEIRMSAVISEKDSRVAHDVLSDTFNL